MTYVEGNRGNFVNLTLFGRLPKFMWYFLKGRIVVLLSGNFLLFLSMLTYLAQLTDIFDVSVSNMKIQLKFRTD